MSSGFPDLRAFLDQLRRDGDLAVVEVPVDPRLEAAEVHRLKPHVSQEQARAALASVNAMRAELDQAPASD